MTKLYLVGTHHLDMKGPERLEKFLGFVRPDVIGIETTEKRFKSTNEDHEGVERQMPLLRPLFVERYGSKKAEEIVKYLNSFSYELWVSSKYIRANPGAKLVFCDILHSERVKKECRNIWEGKVDEQGKFRKDCDLIEEAANTDFEDYQKRIDRTYQDASLGELGVDDELLKEALLSRDEEAERKIREAMRTTENAFVHIGGRLHLFGNYPNGHKNLYERLSDLNPVRLGLIEMDGWGR